MDLRERAETSVRHPWELARSGHVLALLATAGMPTNARVLDAGSGDAFVATTVAAAHPDASVICWDVNYESDDLAAAGAAQLTRVREAPEGPFDVLLALDVIEHVENDVDFLRDLRQRAAPHSLLVLTVPAYQPLFSRHDVALAHFRRYSRRRLSSVLLDSGWRTERLAGFFWSLLPVRVVTVVVERARRPTTPIAPVAHLGTWRRGPWTTRLVHAALAADAALSRSLSMKGRRGVPGLSIYATARPADPWS